jgi:hypothetical protein
MIDFVFWSCVVGFSPIVLVVAVRIVAFVMGTFRGVGARPLAFHADDPAASFFGPHPIR